MTACTECLYIRFGTDSSDGCVATNIYVMQFQEVNRVAGQLQIHEAHRGRMWVSVQGCSAFFTQSCLGRSIPRWLGETETNLAIEKCSRRLRRGKK
jgi:hypothetical protein